MPLVVFHDQLGLPSTHELMTIIIGPSDGASGVQEVTFFDAVRIALNMDSGDTISFAIPSYAPEAVFVDELATDVWITGQITQRFRVVQVEQAWDADGNDVITVNAVSYKRLLNARNLRTALNFANVDQGDIVWGLIAHTQAQPGGDWGVTKGTSLTGQLRDRQYVIGENIGDLAQKLTEVIDGLWWDIDGSLIYSAHMPDDFPLAVAPCELGTNARSLQRRSSGASFANAVYCDGSEEIVGVWRESADILTDPRGRWERTAGFPSVIIQQTLIDHAEGLLQESLSPASVWAVEMEPANWIGDSHYLPGHIVNLLVPLTTAAPIGTPADTIVIQVVEVTIGFTADGALSVALSGVEIS